MAQWVVVSEGERLHPPPDGLQVVLYTARTGSDTPAKGDTLSLYTVPSGGGNAPQVLDEVDWTSSIDGTGVVVFTSTPVYWAFSVSRTYQGILLLTSTNQIYRAAKFTSAWVVSPGDQKGVQLTDYRYDVSDIGQVSQTITVTETGSTFEQIMIAVSVAVTETGAGVETPSVAAVLALTESGAGAEEVSYAGDGEVSVADTGGETSSTVTVSASIPIADSGTDSETLLHSPDSPTITSVTPGDGSNSIDLGTSAGATSYNLYWVDGTNNPTWDTTAEILANGTKITGASDPHSHTSLTNGHEYRYVQTAVNAAGESGGSAVVTGTPAASGIAMVGTPTTQSQNTSGSLVVALPSGVAENDIILIFSYSADTTPSGYTLKKSNSPTGEQVFWKRAGSSESNPSLSGAYNAICSVWRGVSTSGDPFDAVGAAFTSGAGETDGTPSVTVTEITTATNNAMVLLFGTALDGGWDDTELNGPNDGLALNDATGAATTEIAKLHHGPSGNARRASGGWYALKAIAGATGTAVVSATVTETWPGYSVGASCIGLLMALKPA